MTTEELPDFVGRDASLAALAPAWDNAALGRVFVVSGPSGSGKSAILDYAAQRAHSAGIRVWRLYASRSEHQLAWTALHALLYPHADVVDQLADLHRQVLQAVLRLDGQAHPFDRLDIGVALLQAFSVAGPVLVVVDNAQWVDSASMEVLEFAARRLAGLPISLMLASRRELQTVGFDALSTRVGLTPLSDADSRLLLDSQVDSPVRLARELVLAQAAGNPGALVSLSAMVGADKTGLRWLADPLGLPPDLLASYTPIWMLLPESTRDTMLTVSAGSDIDLSLVAGTLPGLDLDALSDAELVGLISVSPRGIEFLHPLFRATAYYLAPFSARARAHHRWAAALIDHPDRAAWHLGQTTLGRDEKIAAALEDTCDAALRRSGYVAATRAMERAAELSSSVRDEARRLIAAAGLARSTGDGGWVENLAHRALAITTDPVQQSRARLELGWLLTWTDHHDAAMSIVLPLATMPDTDTRVRSEALRAAATVAYLSGSAQARTAVAGAMIEHLRLTGDNQPDLSLYDRDYDQSTLLWATVAVNPHGAHNELAQIRTQAERHSEHVIAHAATGVAAWAINETTVALRLLHRAAAGLAALGPGRKGPGVLMALGWSCIDAGRWDQALEVGDELAELGVVRQQPLLRSLGDLICATVLALRGSREEVEAKLDSALMRVDRTASRAVDAWGIRARALIKMAEGNHAAAYSQLRRLFDAEGLPIHPHLSYLSLPDLADAAVSTDHVDDVGAIVARIESLPAPSLRSAQLLSHTAAIIAPTDEAEPLFNAALAVAGGQWPLERAHVQLSFGQWLRRRRRVAEAKGLLTEATGVFETLGAKALLDRASRELRATGVASHELRQSSDLSPQEQQVVQLAAQGLSNREIGALMHISPRTVGGHLYRAYPKLGIVNRSQLRDVADLVAFAGH